MGRASRVKALLVDVGPVLAMAVVIFTLSSFPIRLPPQAPTWSDKVAHLTLFGALAATLWRLWNRRGWPWRAAAVVALTFLYGVSDELHQAFVPGRSPDWKDLLTDTIAAVLVVAVVPRVTGRAPDPAASPRAEEFATRR